ncbi:hypothetical protein I5M32_06850 [Pedobacter sp. SD-b]|uniref:DUF1640 domain-containing protein n=1 Tax=Pedobacter segetis TaxID=2793069 RepID=A0ABS1BIN8_9SPHI|nr:hypothetical protein [Pedobacter segetis]MBK0382677.1 hypothetical protein [Pedobacter segetis]
MDATLKLKVSEIFVRYKFSNEDAGFISEVLDEIDDRQHQKFEVSKELFLTQKDKVELIDRIQKAEISLSDKITNVHKSIFIVGLVQFLAIIGSVLAIFNFMLK